MSNGSLFSTDTVTTEARYQWHLWVADVLDMATAALAGWASLRALEQERTQVTMVIAMGVAWLVVSAVGGIWGRTLWRQLAGVRLVHGARPPGVARTLARAFTTPVDLLIAPVLQRRPFDTMLGLYAEPVTEGVRARMKALVPQLPWLALLVGAVWLIVTPTRAEMVKYLGRTLTGWHCCHGTRDVTWECKTSLSRAVREARSGRADVQAIVADCPVAAERLAKP
ncbi:hypothetical protein [Myxococcus landrumensis]|uniref:RDD domain-containing protein n=1 Tax=Myxococcus landrumensis TaxID=2813577 RepID=A0ABX7N789_9BACT|nr:hypothetical protein [Myxococcus landrumus]QSQ12218.1 hypothetical protein JY572_28155 [Myxococcus landrumus]